MEKIILLFVILAIFNALSKTAKRGARAPARSTPPHPFPGGPGPGPVREMEPSRPRPVVERIRPSRPESRPGEDRASGNGFREQDGVEPVYTPPAGQGERLFATRERLFEAIVFHELLRPPVSRRSR